MGRDDVRAYYDAFGEREWARLANGRDGALEFAVNRRVITAYLPPGARVLDIGGGPGRYSLWLAGQGHRVVLADLSPELLAIARARVAQSDAGGSIEEIVEADARDLARWPDGAFDAALALGPFYHLPDPADRDRAAAELARVVRPDGLVFVAIMPRYAFLRRTLANAGERHHLTRPGFLEGVLEGGGFQNDIPGAFTGGYGFRPEEVAPFFERHGFATLTLVASEGIAPDLQGALAELAASDPAAHQAALDVVLRTAADPSILGLSNHLLYVGRKTAGGRAMVVREATLADVPAIARVQVDTWRTTYRGIVPDDFLDGLTYEGRERQWTVALGPGSRTRLFVGEDDARRVVGFAACGPELGGDPEYQGELYAIYIAAGAEGRGLGRRLVRAVAGRLADEGMVSLLLWVLAQNPSRGFYERLGGREVRTKQIAIGGATLEEVAYGWLDIGVLRERGGGVAEQA